MGQAPDEIRTAIGSAREELRWNLRELESRAKDAADWRVHFRKNPGRMILAALIGGALLSLTLRGR